VQERPPRRLPVLGALRHGALLGPAAVTRLRQDDGLTELRREAGVRVLVASRVLVAADTLEPVAGAAAAVTDTEARQLLTAARAGAALFVLAHEAEVA
jgi:hypothetical protein